MGCQTDARYEYLFPQCQKYYCKYGALAVKNKAHQNIKGKS